MRILFVTGEYPPMHGGVGDYTYKIATTLMTMGHDVAVLTGRRAFGESQAQPGGPTVWPTVDTWGLGLWRQVARAIAKHRADIVHIQYQTAAYGMRPAINMLPLYLKPGKGKAKVVVTFHDLFPPYLFPKAGPVREAVAPLLAGSSDLVIVTNEEDARRAAKPPETSAVGTISVGAEPGRPLISRYGGRPLRLIPIGSNIPMAQLTFAEREAQRARLGALDGETLIAYFGFLGQAKGADVLLRAFRELVSRGMKLRLAMVGGMVGDSDSTQKSYERTIRALADDSRIGGRISWTGFTAASEVSACLQAADMCVLPFREGCSLRHGTLVATLSHGAAIVTTSTPYTSPAGCNPTFLPPELRLRHRDNVYLVEVDDVQGLMRGITDMVDNEHLVQHLREGARRMAPCFSWQSIATQTSAAYDALLGIGHSL